MEDITNTRNGNTHKVNLINCKTCTMTGVVDVISFDPNQVILETELGLLTVKGSELHVKRLHLEKGEVDMEGLMESFVYSQEKAFRQKGESLVSRLFR